MGNANARDAHYDITMANVIARDIHYDVTMSNGISIYYVLLHPLMILIFHQ